MKQQRWSLLISAACSIFSLGMYFIGAFVCANKGDIVKDIFIAIFSSSIFVVALSAIGYVIEKQRLMENIRRSSTSLGLDIFYSVAHNSFENHFQINRSGINTILTTIMDRLKNVKFLMGEYYYGCFFKDKKLKTLINEELFSFHGFLTQFYKENATEKDSTLFTDRFDELLSKYKNCADAIDAWIDSKVKTAKDSDDKKQTNE